MNSAPALVFAAAASLLAACAGTPGPTVGASPLVPAFGPPEAAAELPPSRPFAEGRIGPDGGTVFSPTSTPVTHGVPYSFSLGHCGVRSPVDVDGSFWDLVGAVAADGTPVNLRTDAEMINATSGTLVIVGDEAFFRTETASVLAFERHDGDKEFPACM